MTEASESLHLSSHLLKWTPWLGSPSPALLHSLSLCSLVLLEIVASSTISPEPSLRVLKKCLTWKQNSCMANWLDSDLLQDAASPYQFTQGIRGRSVSRSPSKLTPDAFIKVASRHGVAMFPENMPPMQPDPFSPCRLCAQSMQKPCDWLQNLCWNPSPGPVRHCHTSLAQQPTCRTTQLDWAASLTPAWLSSSLPALRRTSVGMARHM